MKNLYKGWLLTICCVGLSSLSWGQCFNPAINYGAGRRPRHVAVGDFNRDGKLDLVTASFGPSSISVLLNNGNGGFGTANSFNVSSDITSIAVSDFNGDGKLDLATAYLNGTNPVSVFLGDGNGGLGAANNVNVITDVAYSIAVGDFNGDNKPDLVTVNGISNTVSILLNNGSGAFVVANSLNVGVQTNNLIVGDLNGDGKPDLVTTSSQDKMISVLLNAGNGSIFTANSYKSGLNISDLRSIALGDFNGDGKLDIVTANGNDNTVSLLLNDGSGKFNTATEFAINTNFPLSIAVGDYDGDGKTDIATANGNGNTATVILNNGSSGFNATTRFPVDEYPTSIVVGDFNTDGKPDLLTVNTSTTDYTNFGNTVSVLLNCSKASTPTGLTLAQPAYDCSSGQLTLSTTGGNGQAVEYRIAGLRDWAASNSFTIPTYQRTGMSFTLEARQSGQVVILPFATACQSTTPTPPTPPTPPTGTGLSLAAPAYDCNTGLLQLSTTGGNGQLVEYRVAGLRDWSTNNSFTVPAYQLTGTGFTLEARQSGQVASLAFTSACQTSTPPPTPPVTPPTPPAGTPLMVSAQSLNCQTGVLQLVTAGGDGTAVAYKVPGLGDYTASASFTVPTYQRSGTNFTLYARQSGREVTATYTATCPVGARLASAEASQSLKVAVYPNPVAEQFTVGVSGAAGQTVRYHLTNLSGQTLIDQRSKAQDDAHTETLRLPASGAGLYLLRVSTNGQSKTVKVLKP